MSAIKPDGGEWISKRAVEVHTMARPTIPFANARTAFKAFLLELDFSSQDEILLPAYIGWSENEGSGVFDPVRDVGVRFAFYGLTRNLTIDLGDLWRKLRENRPRLVVLIHYFGYPDPNLAEVVSYAREYGALVLEDEAHALYSDWVTGICGRWGDAAIMSLHKMLPFEKGGLLILNPSLRGEVVPRLLNSSLQQPLEKTPLDYDLAEISSARRRNALQLLELIGSHSEKANPLFPALPAGVVPQTLPVVITKGSRDNLYFELNSSGYGVVSLYHTLIDSIREDEFPDSYWLSRRILNLPVHQDVGDGTLEQMVARLAQLL